MRGIASAAASDTTPRTPVKETTKVCCHGGNGSRRRTAGMSLRDSMSRKHPDESSRDHDRRGDGDRRQKFADREIVRLFDERAGLQPRDEKDEALDQIDDQVPEEDALQPRGGRDQPWPFQLT